MPVVDIINHGKQKFWLVLVLEQTQGLVLEQVQGLGQEIKKVLTLVLALGQEQALVLALMLGPILGVWQVQALALVLALISRLVRKVGSEEYIRWVWLANVLPEEWCGELDAQRHKWRKKGNTEFLIELKTSLNILGLFKALIQIEEYRESYIKGWATKVLPEELRGELEALRYEWTTKGDSKGWIELKIGIYMLDILKAYVQIKVENAKLSKKAQLPVEKTKS